MTNQNIPRHSDMTIRQVAEFLNLHPETVRIMARQGRFPGAYKLGTATTAQVRIPWQAVEEYRAKQPRVNR